MLLLMKNYDGMIKTRVHVDKAESKKCIPLINSLIFKTRKI